MGGYSPAAENVEETIIVVGRDRWGALEDAAKATVPDVGTLALFGRAGLTLVEEIGRVPGWRDRRYTRRRLLWGSLAFLTTAGPILVTWWR